MRFLPAFCALIPVLLAASARGGDGNRLVYLDESDPYYVSRAFPKLITPQWVGEDGVEAVIILAIDDMRDHRRYEAFLRPILERLKQIDGRARVSIMTNQIDPATPHLQQWLKEGVSLETHTFDHPCPLLAGGDFAKAQGTYDKCVDLMAEIAGSRPVAFRMPCCDSLNTPSPRFFAEIFNRVTGKGNFLAIDTSVFNITTANDSELPREIVFDEEGRERFRKYVPFDSFVNTIEDYPYPYVIGRLCWEFACATPSDWQAQHLNKPFSPVTVRDMKAGIDAAVAKQGVWNLVFHPHGWIQSEQVVELIDHVMAKHGKKVKFLTFREAKERLERHLLAGQPLRAEDGGENGVRLLDLNDDGYMDVVIGNEHLRQTRVWDPATKGWLAGGFPVELVAVEGGRRACSGARFGVLRGDGRASVLIRSEKSAGVWRFDGTGWVADHGMLAGLEDVFTRREGRDQGVRLRDVNGDGRCELILGNSMQRAVYGWSDETKRWEKAAFALPEETAIVDGLGRDAGLRFVDMDEDGFDDVIFSNDERYGLWLFESMEMGWSRRVMAGMRGEGKEIPMIVREGTNNGAWFHSRHMWVQNEDTAAMPNLVDRRSFAELVAEAEPRPRAAGASLKGMEVRPGFVVELVASEPLVEDPIAFAWGADGKFWVVEMGDYPEGEDGKGAPGGKVKYLEDLDGDGQYDRATVFLEKLRHPTGVMPWKKGVLVTCAPDIFYAEDRDGDGKADVREVLYTGFGTWNQQHLVNGLVWGLDNWIYCANGDSGGEVTSSRTGETVDIRGRDFRIRPDEGLIDAQLGQTQFGRCVDDWGNWFGCSNPNPMFHFVIGDQYLRRNPHLAPPRPVVQVPKVPSVGPVYPISRTLERFNDPFARDRFTSACSVIVYRDDLFGTAFVGNMFVSEPVHNLVHREVMMPRGVTFGSERALEERESEFLASTDNWFRPTTIKTGPDGALWVADMYRYVIEHPRWIPEEWQKRLDLRAGHDRGRIYRIYPVGSRPRAIPRLDGLDAAGLVAALDSASGWQRDMAQQLLVERREKRAAPHLRRLALEGRRAAARLHALCALDGLGALDAELLLRGLADEHAGVRRHAVRVSETWLNEHPELGVAMVGLASDSDGQVRLQVACSLGYWDDPRAAEALGKLVVRDASDGFMASAVMSSLTRGNLEGVIAASMPNDGQAPPARVLEDLLRVASGMGHAKATTLLLEAVVVPHGDEHATWQLGVMGGLLDALDQSGAELAKAARGAEGPVNGLFDAARSIAVDGRAPAERRAAAARLLGRGLKRREEDLPLLAGLLSAQTPAEVQAAAVSALGRQRSAESAEILLGAWRGYTPALRTQVLSILLGREEWTERVLDALEGGEIAGSELDAQQRQRLLQQRARALRERAERLLADVVHPDRQKVLDSYAAALHLAGDAGRGREVFANACASCHRMGDLGHGVGPDLAGLSDKSPESLLIGILDPNRAVESKYIGYIAETRDDAAISGVLAAGTGSSITILAANGESHDILRSDLKKLRSTGLSLMPEGLESGYEAQDMADLIAFIRGSAPPRQRKTFEGNRPEVVRSGERGMLRLLPANCEIYGSTLVLEKQYGNLGFWQSEDDEAVWTIEVDASMKYAVWLEWACDDSTAGNAYLLRAGGERLTGYVRGTGVWDTYHKARIGEITLQPGRHEVVFRSAGKINGALIDLKAVELVPPNEVFLAPAGR